MRKSFFLPAMICLVFLISTSNCSQEVYEDESFVSSRLTQIEELTAKHPIVNEYSEAFGEIVSYIQTINTQKDKEELGKLLDAYQEIKNSKETKLSTSSFENDFYSLYTQEEMKIIERMKNRLDVLGNKLKEDKGFLSFTDNQHMLFIENLTLKFQNIRVDIDKFKQGENVLKTRSESTSECEKKCEDAYYLALAGIVAASICVIGGTIIEACMSMGTLSIPAMLRLIAEVGATSIALDMATNEYNRCINECKQNR